MQCAKTLARPASTFGSPTFLSRTCGSVTNAEFFSCSSFFLATPTSPEINALREVDVQASAGANVTEMPDLFAKIVSDFLDDVVPIVQMDQRRSVSECVCV